MAESVVVVVLVGGEVGKYFLLKARAGQSLLLLAMLGGFRS